MTHDYVRRVKYIRMCVRHVKYNDSLMDSDVDRMKYSEKYEAVRTRHDKRLRRAYERTHDYVRRVKCISMYVRQPDAQRRGSCGIQ